MKYLFDTDMLGDLMGRAPSPALLRRLAATPPGDQATSSITLGELLFAAQSLRRPAPDLAERIDRVLVANVAVLPFDAGAAQTYGALRAELALRGTPIRDSTLRIASIALTRDLTVVTGEVCRYEPMPALRVENWLA